MTKKEKRARLAYLRTCTKEELMMLYYAHKKECAQKNSMIEDARIFDTCKGKRTPKKARNTFSKEEFGTCGTCTKVMRFAGSRETCVYKSRNLY